jgi:hypothetical protein
MDSVEEGLKSEWENLCSEIYEKTQLLQRYAYINQNIPNTFYLRKGTVIKALVK